MDCEATEEIVDRFCLLGPAAAHIAKLKVLRQLGADQFAIHLMHDAQKETLDACGRIILPALQAAARS